MTEIGKVISKSATSDDITFFTSRFTIRFYIKSSLIVLEMKEIGFLNPKLKWHVWRHDSNVDVDSQNDHFLPCFWYRMFFVVSVCYKSKFNYY